VEASIRSMDVMDTFYSGDDMYLVSTRAFGSSGDFFHVTCRINNETQPVTTVRATTSPIIVNYTNSTLHFVMGLNRELRKGRPVIAPDSQASTETSSPVSRPREAALEAESLLEPIVDFELLTEPITITVCSSKLNPLVRFMLNSIDLTYVSCGDKGHAATMIDLGVYYHNLKLSAWEPCMEWTTFKFDRQTNGNKQMVSLFSDETINFNITAELIVDLMSLYVDAETELDDDPNNDVSDDSMLYVHNNCGVPISFNVMNASNRDHRHTGPQSTNSIHPSSPDHEGWIKVWDTYIDDQLAVAVPRENMHHNLKPQTFDPAALGQRGELSTNYVLICVDRIHHSAESGQPSSTEWRPLRPQSLSTHGSFLHFLENTDNARSDHTIANRPFIRTVVDRENGAHKITAESPVLVTNDLPVDLRMQLTDDAHFERDDVALPRLRGSIPVPLHLVERKMRFQKKNPEPREEDKATEDGQESSQVGWMWTDYVRPGDESVDSVVLMSPDECLAYCLHMDMTRGPRTCHVVLHCPLKFENLLPCAMWITLAQHETKKRTKNQNIVYERFRLEKGARYTPPHVDVRFGMAISIELEDLPGTEASHLDELSQKQQAVVWPKSSTDKTVTLVDAQKRKLNLSLEYKYQAGKPTEVSVFVSHWIINETGVNLKYFDLSSGSAAKPANYENRPHRSPAPFMFSVREGLSGKFGVGLKGGKVDHKAVPLNHTELCTTLEVKTPSTKDKEPRMRHRILCQVTNGHGRFSRTKMVYLRHLLHFQNCTPYTIAIKPAAGELPAILIPAHGGMRPLSWPKDDSLPKQLKLFCDHDGLLPAGAGVSGLDTTLVEAQWTSEFEVCDQAGAVRITEFWLKVAKQPNGYGYKSVRVEVTIEPETSHGIVVLREEEEHPYTIENHLDMKIGFRQQDSQAGTDRENWQELLPRHFSPFLWDFPLSTQRVEVIIQRSKYLFDIDEVGLEADHGEFRAEVVLRGHTRVLILRKPGGAHRVEDSLAEQSSLDILDNQVVEVRMHSVGFSLIDDIGSTPTELLYSFFDGIHYHSGQSSSKNVVEFKISDWQIADQTSQDTSTSVVLGRAHSHLSHDSTQHDSVTDAETINGTRDHFHLSIIRDLHNSSPMSDVYSFLGVGIYPCVITIQDEFILRLYGHCNAMHKKLLHDFPSVFAEAAAGDTSASPTSTRSGGEVPEMTTQAQAVHKVFCHQLQIHPIMLTVTVRLDGIFPEWAQSLGVVFGNIDRAPLSFEAVNKVNHFETSSSFIDALTYNYWTQMLKGSYRVLGAADFLGNPTQLFGKETRPFAPFIHKNDHFTKTGSGQT
jgi:hypothetical protein